MQASADNLAFAPPPEPAAVRAFVLAVLAHLLLMIGLAWGIHWQKEPTMAAEAELWARMPEQAAPPPAPVVPQPAPPPVIEKPAPPPVVKQPDIVQEREKKRREEEAQRLREEEERQALEAKKKRQQEEAARREQERKKQEQLAKAEKEKKAADDKKLAQMREENMRRMQGMAGSSGAPSDTGSALRSKGPSASYAGRIAGRIKPNIVFTDVIAANPAAVVELRVAPDGTIVGSKLVKSSGVKTWDEAVLRAIDKTGSIPRDTDGSVVPEFEIEFRPKN